MSATGKKRGPAAFELDDPRVRLTEHPLVEESGGAAILVAPVRDEAALPVPAERLRRSPRWRFGLMFWSAAGGLVLLALGLSLVALVEELFARSQAFGLLGLTLAVVAGGALAAVIARETLSLMRLVSVDAIRARAASAIASDDRREGQLVIDDLLKLTRRIPELARRRASLEGHRADIIDGRDLVNLAERELMAPLDREARRLIGNAAKRVSVVTAVSPRAAVDMLFVLLTALGLIRRLAALYGARPGMLGLVRLVRHVVSHLTLTGGMAASDSLIQQIIGHGVAAKLSARLGEGVLNGLVTARLGLAAMDGTRPLPFSALPQPSLNDLASQLLRSSGPAKSGGAAAAAGPGRD